MNIRDIFRYLICLVAVTLLSAIASGCSENPPQAPGDSGSADDSFRITGSVIIPDMPKVLSRGDAGDTPGSNLKLTILEFDLGKDDAHSFLSNIYNADIKSSTAVGNTGEVIFDVTIKGSSSPKVLHLMVADEYLTSQYGSVATIIPELTVADFGSASEAYWGMVKFEQGFTRPGADGKPELLGDVRGKLMKVPLIRNFLKITVTADLENFRLLGFDLINVPTYGTVAPWNQEEMTVPDLLSGNKMKKYEDLDYPGIIPVNAQFHNIAAEARYWDDDSPNLWNGNGQSRYMYEHPYESSRRTSLIIHGIYTSGTTNTRGFYKIDIGRTNETTGMFECYNLIRNIHYNITITGVYAAGMPTVSQAIDRAPFNNISAAVETSSMLNISDNKNLLVVNATNHIIVDNDKKIELLYRYEQNIDGGNSSAGNDIPFLYPEASELEKGPVIKTISKKKIVTDNLGTEWVKYEIICNNPTDIVKTQSFAVVDGTGLGRTINLVLRNPWPYSEIYPGGYATVAPGDENQYDTADPEPKDISKESGQPLTVYFNLPNGLPESMFPLEFQLESKHQWIENNKIGNLVVTSGPSLFDPAVTAISYIKKVSYEEYKYLYFNDGSNNLDPNQENTKHTIRCRFLTIAEAEGEAEIKIHNPYFDPDPVVKFKRVAESGQ